MAENNTGDQGYVTSILDLLNHPASRVVPHFDADADRVRSVEDETESVIRALRAAVEKTPDEYLPAAASSAFHIQPYLEGLCRDFERPVENIAISNDGFVIVNLRSRDGSVDRACIVMGPHGEGAQQISSEKRQSHGFLQTNAQSTLGPGIIESLTKAGLKPRCGGVD